MKKSMEKLKKNLQKVPKSKPVAPKTEPSDFELEIEVNTAELEIEDINRALGDEQVVHVDAFYPQKFTCTPFLFYYSYTFFFRPQGNLPRNRATQGQITVRASLFLGIFLVPFPQYISSAIFSITGLTAYSSLLLMQRYLPPQWTFLQSNQQLSAILTTASTSSVAIFLPIFYLFIYFYL